MVSSTLKESASVMSLSHNESISMMVIDEATTAEKVAEALSTVTENDSDSSCN